MFTKENTIYADAFKYLKHKEKNVIALSLSYKGNKNDFEEFHMNNPIDVEIDGDMIFWDNRKFANRPVSMTKEGIKTSIIKSRYSNDDQIAIILNKDSNEDTAMYYQKMQEWRGFAAVIAKSIQY